MISFVRVDNRLIHGQVVEAWLPHLKVSRVVVADDEAAHSPLVRAAMGLAIQSTTEVVIGPLNEIPFLRLAEDAVRTMLLVREVGGVVEASSRGLRPSHVNLGNVHYSAPRRKLTPSIFLSSRELEELNRLQEMGAQVEAQAVPSEKPVPLAELWTRFQEAPP